MSKDSRSAESSRNVWNATADGHLPRQAFSTFEEDPEQSEATALPPCPDMMYSLVNYRNLSPAGVLLPSPEDTTQQHTPRHHLHHDPHHEHYDTLPATTVYECPGPPIAYSSVSFCHQTSLKAPTSVASSFDSGDSSFSSGDDALPSAHYQNVEMMGTTAMGAMADTFLRSNDRDDAPPPPLPGRWTRVAAKAARDLGRCVATISGAHGTPEWLDDPARFTCAVSAPSKRSKFGGIKSYLAYKLTSSSAAAAADSPAPSSVWRRYKQFTWLRARLEEKFPAVVVPRLPGTLPAAARYAPECVRRRVGELSLWLEHVTGHPALAGCDVLRHFLTCGDNVEEWKGGKRRAERDRHVGHSFYLGVDVRCSADLQHAEELGKSMKLFHVNAESSMAELRQATWQAVSQWRDGGRRSYERLALALNQLGATFSALATLPGPPAATGGAAGGGAGGGGLGPLGSALVQAGNAIRAAGLAATAHARADTEPLNEAVSFYGGLTCGLPELLKLHNSALSRAKDEQRRHVAGRAANHRANTVLCVCMAEELEVSRAGERIFKRALALFLEGQLAFHRHMVKELEECLQACAYE
ncbi:sorting nexin-33-like isoform X2 [Lampetra planeri]